MLYAPQSVVRDHMLCGLSYREVMHSLLSTSPGSSAIFARHFRHKFRLLAATDKKCYRISSSCMLPSTCDSAAMLPEGVNFRQRSCSHSVTKSCDHTEILLTNQGCTNSAKMLSCFGRTSSQLRDMPHLSSDDGCRLTI